MKTQSLVLVLMAGFIFIGCDVEEAASELAKSEEAKDLMEGEEDYGDYDDEEMTYLSEDSIEKLAQLKDEEINSFKICIEGEGEKIMEAQTPILNLEEEDFDYIDLNSSACEGSYSIQINEVQLQDELSFEVDGETTREDILEELFYLAQEDGEHDDEDEDCEEDHDENEEE